jgi:hypothetical protein
MGATGEDGLSSRWRSSEATHRGNVAVRRRVRSRTRRDAAHDRTVVLNALSRKIRAFRSDMRAHFSREGAFARKMMIAFLGTSTQELRVLWRKPA